MKRWIGLLVFVSLASLVMVLTGPDSEAHTPTEPEFLAATLTADELDAWITGLKNAPKSVSIFSVRAVAPLDAEYASVMEAEIVKRLRTDNGIRVSSCLECRSPQIQVKGERLVITRGAPDIDTLKTLAKKGDAETFLVIDIYRTPLSVITQATLYESGNGEILDSNRFKIPSLDFSSSAMQFMLGVGPGFAVGGSGGSSSGSNIPPIAVNLSILEELGFGKGGFNLGFVGAAAGSYGYIMPELAFRGTFGGTSLYSLKTLGVGFGVSNNSAGVAARLAYDLFLGSFTFIGLEASAMIPVSSGSGGAFEGFGGIHFGLSLGR